MRKISVFGKTNSIVAYIKGIDTVILIFITINLIWATIIPIIVRKNTTFAFKDFSTILVLLLYFPCVFLLRLDAFPRAKARRLFRVLVLLLAMWHIVIYFGEEKYPGFHLGYYDLIDVLSFGSAVRTGVIHGFGYTRVIQVTTVFLIPALFGVVEQAVNRNVEFEFYALILVLAILVTFTRSIWFGVLIGLAISSIGCWIFVEDRDIKRRLLMKLLLLCTLITVINFSIFENQIFIRALPSRFVDETQYSAIENHDKVLPKQNNDITIKEDTLRIVVGTKFADQVRATQLNDLINKWQESKAFGFGYGAFTEKNIRNTSHPFMYELTFPALLMKLGILGISSWIFLIVSLIITAYKNIWTYDRFRFLIWLGTAIAFALSVQTNPFLFTFAGMSIILIICISAEWGGDPKR